MNVLAASDLALMGTVLARLVIRSSEVPRFMKRL